MNGRSAVGIVAAVLLALGSAARVEAQIWDDCRQTDFGGVVETLKGDLRADFTGEAAQKGLLLVLSAFSKGSAQSVLGAEDAFKFGGWSVNLAQLVFQSYLGYGNRDLFEICSPPTWMNRFPVYRISPLRDSPESKGDLSQLLAQLMKTEDVHIGTESVLVKRLHLLNSRQKEVWNRPDLEASTMIVSGRVVAGGRPVAGAVVQLVRTSDRKIVDRQVTAEDGSFAFADVIGVVFEVQVVRVGYLAVTREVVAQNALMTPRGVEITLTPFNPSRPPPR